MSFVAHFTSSSSNIMLSILFFIFSGFIGIIVGNISLEFDRIRERLENSAHQQTLTELVKIPKASFYLNSQLTQNVPHRIDLTKQLTSIISEWNPRLLTLDPTCPYYFSQIDHSSSSEDGLNLLSYLHAVESNETLSYPFINVLPLTYRPALPLPSIFHCQELIDSTIDPFFHNIELIVGPGQTKLPFHQPSNEYSSFYCSLYGSPSFFLINQTEQTLFTDDHFNYLSASLPPGFCLFIPSDWNIGAQLNNSITLRLTFQSMLGKFDERCTKIEQVTFDQVVFAIEDQLNITGISVMMYFYEYLNPPIFDQEFTSTSFLQQFQVDQNVSQLVIQWTSELIELIEMKLFQQLDINDDQRFSIDDYFDIRSSMMKQIEDNLPLILEEIRRTILTQYNQLSDIIKRISQQSSADGLDDDDKATLITTIENLPKSVQENFKRKNLDINDVLNKIYHAKSKPSSKKKQHEENPLNRIDL